MNTDEHGSVFICVHLWFRFWLRFYCTVKFVASFFSLQPMRPFCQRDTAEPQSWTTAAPEGFKLSRMGDLERIFRLMETLRDSSRLRVFAVDQLRPKKRMRPVKTRPWLSLRLPN